MCLVSASALLALISADSVNDFTLIDYRKEWTLIISFTADDDVVSNLYLEKIPFSGSRRTAGPRDLSLCWS